MDGGRRGRGRRHRGRGSQTARRGRGGRGGAGGAGGSGSASGGGAAAPPPPAAPQPSNSPLYRDCSWCACRVPAAQWAEHEAGIAHRRAAASVRLHGEPGHAVVSVFERAYAGDAAAQQRAEHEATAGERRQQQLSQQRDRDHRQKRRHDRGGGGNDGNDLGRAPPTLAAANNLPAWLSPVPGHFRVPDLPELGDLPLSALARVRREAMAEAAALCGSGGTLYDTCCRRLLAPFWALHAVHEAVAVAGAWPARAAREQRDLLPLAWMAAMAGKGVRLAREVAALAPTEQQQQQGDREREEHHLQRVRTEMGPATAAALAEAGSGDGGPGPTLPTRFALRSIHAEGIRLRKEACLSVLPAPINMRPAWFGREHANAHPRYTGEALMEGGGHPYAWLRVQPSAPVGYADAPEHAALMVAAAALWEAGGVRLLSRPAQWPPSAGEEEGEGGGPPSTQIEGQQPSSSSSSPLPRFARQDVTLVVPCLTHGAEALALAAGWAVALRAAARCPAIGRVNAIMDPHVPNRQMWRAVQTQGERALELMRPVWARALRGLAAVLRPGADAALGGGGGGGGGMGVLERLDLTVAEELRDSDVERDLQDALNESMAARRRALLAGAMLPRDAAPPSRRQAGRRRGRSEAGGGSRAEAAAASPLRRLPTDVLRLVMAKAGLVEDPDMIALRERLKKLADAPVHLEMTMIESVLVAEEEMLRLFGLVPFGGAPLSVERCEITKPEEEAEERESETTGATTTADESEDATDASSEDGSEGDG
jgi:hypothetical protein